MAHFYKIFQRFTNGLLGALFDHFSLFEVKKLFLLLWIEPWAAPMPQNINIIFLPRTRAVVVVKWLTRMPNNANDLSLNPAEVYSFYSVNYFENNENKRKMTH